MLTEDRRRPSIDIDALLPPQIAIKAEEIGVKKVKQNIIQTLLLSFLAGAFIGFAALFYTTTITGGADLPFGVKKMLGGLAFCLGLVLVVIAGAELFTGNNLKVMALASGKISPLQLSKSWLLVYIGNLIGSVATAYGIYLTGQYAMADYEVGRLAINIANAKCQLPFIAALFRGIYCNVLVCLAVWLCLSARSSTDKILCILFPITAFVACGFEHCVANMYFIPMGMILKADSGFLASIGTNASDYAALSMQGFIKNLIPVTIGNIIGGAILVGAVYWLVYRFGKDKIQQN